MSDDFTSKVRKTAAEAFGTVPHPSEELEQAYIAVIMGDVYSDRNGIKAAFAKFEKIIRKGEQE